MREGCLFHVGLSAFSPAIAKFVDKYPLSYSKSYVWFYLLLNAQVSNIYIPL